MSDQEQQQDHHVREKRTTIEGCWILDKTRLNWSMNEYLQTMNVDPLAIEAHEKGEKEHDTYHTIEFISNDNSNNNSRDGIKIIKRSRVNNDVIVELQFGQEYVQYLQPNNRIKSSIASYDHNGKYICIKSKLVTTENHGTAIVTDIKRLIYPNNEEYLTNISSTDDTTTPVDDNNATETAMTKDGDIVTSKEEATTSTLPIQDQAEEKKEPTTATTNNTNDDVVLLQELTIVNEETGQSHTTKRYFLPYFDTPPHLVIAKVATTTEDMNDE